jgi:hypothetical protein
MAIAQWLLHNAPVAIAIGIACGALIAIWQALLPPPSGTVPRRPDR